MIPLLKKIKTQAICPWGGEKFTHPVMILESKKIVCLSCKGYRILKSAEIPKEITHHNNRTKKKFYKWLKEINNPDEVFVNVLASQSKAAEIILDDPQRNDIRLNSWFIFQFILENMKVRLNINGNSSPLPSISSVQFDELCNLADAAIAVDRVNNELLDGHGIYVYLQVTGKCYYSHTIRKFYLYTLPHMYQGLKEPSGLFEFIDLDIWRYNSPVLLEYNMYDYTNSKTLQLITTLRKLTFDLLRDDNIQINYELLSETVNTLLGLLENGRYCDFITKNVCFISNETMKFFLSHIEDFIFKIAKIKHDKITVEDFEKFKQDLVETFYSFDSLQSVIYPVKNGYYASIPNLKLLWELFQLRLSTKEKNLREHRRKMGFGFEKRIWLLGLHFGLNLAFPDNTHTLNIFKDNNKKDIEIADVLFYNKEYIDVIECKTDYAINLHLQLNYFAKLSKKTDLITSECQSRGLHIDQQEYQNNLLIPMSIMDAPPDINVFIHETQLLEYLIRRYGLQPWDLDSLPFGQYPILARIGLENYDKLLSSPLIIDEIGINISKLSVGRIVNGNLIISLSESHLINFQISQYKDEILNDSKAIVLLDKNDTLLDVLLLPPYFGIKIENIDLDNYNDLCIKSSDFHATDFGQRFIQIAVLNTTYGSCEECTIGSLYPYGYPSKPLHCSLRGICINCNHEQIIEMNFHDHASYHEINDSFTELKETFSKRIKLIF